MTNTEIIQAIKAEIEKRLKNTRDYMNGAGMKYKGPKYHASRGRESAYDAILSFLSTLESEKPIDGLEEEINRTYHDGSVADTSDLDHNSYENIARHFAQWQKEQDEKEQADLFTIVALDAAQRAKEQMMKEAVEGEVCIPNVWVEHKEGKELVVRAEISKELGFKFGDKVRVIVLPKEC